MIAKLKTHPLAPALAALVVVAGLMVYVCAGSGHDPSALLLLGSKESPLEPEWFPKGIVAYDDIAGYDGAAYYLVALDPFMLDADLLPAFRAKGVFRYQRVGYPALAWALGLGQPRAILWAMQLVNLVSIALGTWCVALLLRRHKLPVWPALVFGLSPGFAYSAVYSLTEPLALCLTAAALLWYDEKRFAACWVALMLGLVVRETVVLFVVGVAAYEVTQKRWARSAMLMAAGVPAFVLHKWTAYRLESPFSGGSGFAFTWPFKGIWDEIMSWQDAETLIRLAREATVLPWMLFVIAAFGFALWTTLFKRSPYVACLGANALLLLFGYQDWWRTFVNGTRVGAGVPLALVAAYVHRPTRFGKALLAVATLLAALGVARVLADAWQPFHVL